MWMDNWVLNLPPELWPHVTAPNREHPQPLLFRFFESQRRVVVLSSSNKADREANPERCAAQNVPILQRKGGGGTVVLGPGCLILTFAFFAKDIFGNSHYFELVNSLWMAALQELGIHGLTQRGISDIAAGAKKIAGTSVFRKKHLFVYQGSLLVEPDLEKIEELLQHPSREPDYRAGRSHLEFVTSIRQLGFPHSTQEIAEHCRAYFHKHAPFVLSEHFAPDNLIKKS